MPLRRNFCWFVAKQMTKKQKKDIRVETIHKRIHTRTIGKYIHVNTTLKGRILLLLWFLVTIFLTWLAGTILFQPGIIRGPIAVIIAMGMDPLRARFIAALIMTASSALIGAALVRRKLASMIGSGIVLWLGFLNGFVQAQLQPALDPGGLIEPLNSAALFHNSLLILSLGMLSAFIGMAIGAALGETMIDPIYYLASRLWQHWTGSYFSQEVTIPQIKITRLSDFQTRGALLIHWVAAIGMVIILVLAANSADLFIISPDVGIHTPPTFTDQNGNALTGTVVPDGLVSQALDHQNRPLLVYLPPSYNLPAGQRKHYPVLYLLHGAPGKSADWISGGKADESANTLIATKKIPELIIVIPDGNGQLQGNSEWGNSYDQHQMMETFVVNDLVAYIDKHYRTIPDVTHRAIGGLSMGGFGATNIAIHHPDIFGSVISLGGYYQAEGPIWGKNEKYKQANSPVDSILHTPQAAQLQIFLGAAKQDEPYYTDTQQFVKVIVNLHIRYNLDVESGYHSWVIWQKQMYNSLLWLSWQ